MARIPLLFILIMYCMTSWSQTSEEAYALGVEGILKVDSGEYKEGIALLKKARNLEPKDYDFAFEIGKAYLKSGNPKLAEKYLYPLQYHANVQADLYVLLSLSYQELEEKKGKPNPDRKRELDALRYGIQKLPSEGVLYLELGRRNIEMERPIEALAVFELGIQKAPNFAENYYWAAKLLMASNNFLWSWIYAEVCFNQTDDIDLKRSAAIIIASSSNSVFTNNWKADPEKLDQDIQFYFKSKCAVSMSDKASIQIEKRTCLITEYDGALEQIIPVLNRLKLITSKGWLEEYVWSILQESDKESFLAWIPQNVQSFDEYRNWSYWNPLVLKSPINRLNQ